MMSTLTGLLSAPTAGHAKKIISIALASNMRLMD